MLKILIPKKEGICRIASDEFAALWRKATGQLPEVVTEDDGKSDLAVLGSDAVNAFTHGKIIEKVIPQFTIRTNTDDYQLISAEDSGRRLLFIAGGRPRALLYGVYHFFEFRADCRYFWDGDIIPQQETIDITGVSITARPRFEYRGLRYFAHRSLNRFQAEHWDFDEWKQEIDWMLKKRLNLFMLRIGIDDLFQKAFPELVDYPGYEVPESKERSYDDRNLFWSLKYRGELRRKILAYARERDLLHPEDLGTMTHWYSRTPYDFLNKVKPKFMPQATKGYNQPTGLVWDIRDDKNLDNYFKLTETHIREYGAPEIFHTIGLAERRCYEDHASNHQMKLYTYRRIISKLREKYPNAPLLIGSWDFCMYWNTKEVQELTAELDPEHTLIFEYTSDTTDEINNFTNWGLIRKFPWIFGIFHAYEPANEIRGNYDIIERRLPLAADDPMCKGLVLWPECSHTDTLMLDYMPANAWNPDQVRIDGFLPGFCRRRYVKHTEEMYEIWWRVLPLAKLTGWSGPQDPAALSCSFSDMLFRLLSNSVLSTLNVENLGRLQRQQKHFEGKINAAPEIFRKIAALNLDDLDKFMRRDIIDLARTTVSRVQSYGFARLALSMEEWRNGKCSAGNVLERLGDMKETVRLEADLLAAHEDYSLYDALKLLEKKHETYPLFEKTLKGNAENGYCRSYISELFSGVYLPEMEAYTGWAAAKIQADDHTPWEYPEMFEETRKTVRDKFYETPLKDLAPDHAEAFGKLSATLKKLAETTEKIIR